MNTFIKLIPAQSCEALFHHETGVVSFLKKSSSLDEVSFMKNILGSAI